MKAPPTVKEISALRIYAPQFFAYIDELAKTASAGDALYEKAYDIVRVVKRKRSPVVIDELLRSRLGDMPEARDMLWDDFYRRTPGGKEQYAEADRLVATRKAGTLIAAWLVGFKVGTTHINVDDDAWLREPAFLTGKSSTSTGLYWAACCGRVGVRFVEDALSEDDDIVNHPDVVPEDGSPCWQMNQLPYDKYPLENLIDYAFLLASAVKDSGGLEPLVKALDNQRSLSEAQISRIMFEHDIRAGSLRAYDIRGVPCPVSLDVAPSLSVEDKQVALALDNDGFDSHSQVIRGQLRPLKS